MCIYALVNRSFQPEDPDMDRKIMLAGAAAIVITASAAVAFTGLGRGFFATAAEADQNRPIQRLLAQQAPSSPSTSTAPTQLAPSSEPQAQTPATPATSAPQRLAQATPATPAAAPAPVRVADTPASPPTAADAPTVTPGADSAPPDTTAAEAAADAMPKATLPRFMPTSGPAPRSLPQRTRGTRVALGDMCK
jgi:hypothetical protein